MKIAIFRKFTLPIGLALLSPVQAELATGNNQPSFEFLQAVDNETLDGMRGGFVTGGAKLDIGIEKASYVDGVLQVQNSFRAEDLALFNTGSGVSLKPSDMENISSSLNTLIQNNLDQKRIENFTVIDVNVRNFSSIQNSTIESIRSLQDVQVLR